MDEQKAFPYRYKTQSGMSLRDYFAAKAMNATIMADPEDTMNMKEIATFAYEMADAMLKEREL